MKINKEQKEMLNQLIAYYRKEYSQTDEAYLVKNFILDEDGIPICSPSTLSRLENNKTLGHDNVYYSLIENLDMHYEYNERINTIIKEVNTSILKYAEYTDIKKITNLISKTINVLEPYRDHIVYRETIELYELIYNYYNDFSFNKKHIDKSITLFHLVEPPLQAVVLDIAFVFYSRMEINHYHSLYIIQLSKSIHIISTIKEYLNLMMYFREYNMSKVKELCQKLIHKCEKTNNKYYLCRIYNVYASLYSSINLDLAIKYLKLAVDLYNSENDFECNLNTYLRNLGTSACINKNFELAKTTFEKIILNDNNLIIAIFPYYIYSLYKENTSSMEIIQKLVQIKRNENKIESKCFIYLFHLFEIKFNLLDFSYLKLNLNNIIENINLVKEVPFIFGILEDVLYDICKENNKLFIYNDFVKIFNN